MTSTLSSSSSSSTTLPPAPPFLTRFRHTSGDILLPCSPTARISELKEKLCAAWPKDGPLAAEAPATAEEVRLIALGRFVNDKDTLFPLEEAPSTSGRGAGKEGKEGKEGETVSPSLRPPRGAALPGPPVASYSSSAPVSNDGTSVQSRHPPPPPTLHVVVRRKGESKAGGGKGSGGGGKGGSGCGGAGEGGSGGCCSCAVQ